MVFIYLSSKKMSWTTTGNTLQKKFTLGSFNEVISRLGKLTEITDKLNHHPDFRVYGYKNIEFTLTTHSARKVTEKDELLAKEIDRLFG